MMMMMRACVMSDDELRASYYYNSSWQQQLEDPSYPSARACVIDVDGSSTMFVAAAFANGTGNNVHVWHRVSSSSVHRRTNKHISVACVMYAALPASRPKRVSVPKHWYDIMAHGPTCRYRDEASSDAGMGATAAEYKPLTAVHLSSASTTTGRRNRSGHYWRAGERAVMQAGMHAGG